MNLTFNIELIDSHSQSTFPNDSIASSFIKKKKKFYNEKSVKNNDVKANK